MKRNGSRKEKKIDIRNECTKFARKLSLSEEESKNLEKSALEYVRKYGNFDENKFIQTWLDKRRYLNKDGILEEEFKIHANAIMDLVSGRKTKEEIDKLWNDPKIHSLYNMNKHFEDKIYSAKSEEELDLIKEEILESYKLNKLDKFYFDRLNVKIKLNKRYISPEIKCPRCGFVFNALKHEKVCYICSYEDTMIGITLLMRPSLLSSRSCEENV